jgi:hypothetical protein
MYLGTLHIYTKFWPDQISNMAVRPGGHLGKATKSKVLLLLNLFLDYLHIFIICTSIKDTWHNTPVLILPTFQGHRGQSLKQITKFAYFVIISPGKF